MRRHIALLIGALALAGPLAIAPSRAVAEETTANPVPAITSISATRTSVYPARDTYADRTDFAVAPMWSSYPDQGFDARLEIWDSGRTTLLRSLPLSWQSSTHSNFTWDGRTEDGAPFAAGLYATRAVYTDDTGDVSTRNGPNISIVRKHLSPRDWATTVSARGSKIGAFVGRCSTLRTPSVHGWAGSLGLLSNKRCRSTAPSGLVRTVHQITAPIGARYDGVRVAAYGGSSRFNLSDSPVFSLRNGESWSGTELPSTVGWQRTDTSGTVARDRTIQWKLTARGGDRYDIRSFRVSFRYWVLVAD